MALLKTIQWFPSELKTNIAPYRTSPSGSVPYLTLESDIVPLPPRLATFQWVNNLPFSPRCASVPSPLLRAASRVQLGDAV